MINPDTEEQANVKLLRQLPSEAGKRHIIGMTDLQSLILALESTPSVDTGMTVSSAPRPGLEDGTPGKAIRRTTRHPRTPCSHVRFLPSWVIGWHHEEALPSHFQ